MFALCNIIQDVNKFEVAIKFGITFIDLSRCK